MQFKASNDRDNSDFEDLKLELTPFGKDLTVKLTLTNGNEIEFTLNDVGKKEITEEHWFAFEYDYYVFNGEFFYVDDDPDSDNIALNVYTAVESDESETGFGMGDDIGVYAECVCHLD